MVGLTLLLLPVAFVLSAVMTAGLVRLGHALRTFDSAGVAGQVKAERRTVPNTGGVAIVWAVLVPLGAALLAAAVLEPGSLPAFLASAGPYWSGVREELAPATALAGCVLVLHGLGLLDDRRPLGPWVKFAVMFAVAGAVVYGTGSRLMTFLDAPAGGPWLSAGLTVVWIVVVTNALNFLDNMDGLSAGVAAIAGACFLAATLIQGQWFIGAMLALLVGALLGFLLFNFPFRARTPDGRGGALIFMGDGGSLVVGFLLAVLTVRTTYIGPELGGGWYGLLMPVLVLAVPLYDLVAVSVIRLRHGRSPLVGDLNHLSHRLERRGLSRRGAVLVIYGLTAATALPSIGLGALRPWQAALVGLQAVVLLGVIALLEARADFGRTVRFSESRGGGGA